MFGLINSGLRDYVNHHHGRAVWARVCQYLPAGDDLFVSMEYYPDETTGRIVDAICLVCRCSAAVVWEEFGEYWMQYTAEQSFGDLLSLGGRDVAEFLTNLDGLHARLAMTYPRLNPPLFRLETIAPGRYRLHYGSTRQGLEPFVLGLVRGLGKRCGQQVDLAVESVTGEGQAVFSVLVTPKTLG